VRFALAQYRESLLYKGVTANLVVTPPKVIVAADGTVTPKVTADEAKP
jgi:hypothetical protein